MNGPDYSNIDIKVQGFTIEIDTGKLRAVWNIPNKVMLKVCIVPQMGIVVCGSINIYIRACSDYTSL